VLLASLSAALAGCTVRAATEPNERVIPLPAGSFYVTALDSDRLAALVQMDAGKLVQFVHVGTGETDGRFDAPPDTIALAPAGPDRILLLTTHGETSALKTFSSGGAELASLPLPGKALALSAPSNNQDYVLMAVSGGRTILHVVPASSKILQPIAAPAHAAGLAAHIEGFHTALLVADEDGTLYQHVPQDNSWSALSGSGSDPVYSQSGHAIYVLERFGQDKFVSVVARPFGLPIRMFPVAGQTSQITSGSDNRLIVLERVGSSSAARELGCRSPLLETRPYLNKHAAYYFDEGNRAVSPGTERGTADTEAQMQPC